MLDSEDFAEDLALAQPMPLALRLFFGAAGLFVIVMPAWEFRAAFLHPGLHSLFFGALVLGAWCVGGGFVAAALLNEDQRWRARDGEIHIDRSTLWRRWTTLVRRENVLDMTIKENEGDGEPNTFSVVLRLKSNEEFETRCFEKRENAEKLEKRLRRILHLD